MSAHLRRAIDDLMKQLISLTATVEENVKRSLVSLEENDIDIARNVIEEDKLVDQREIDIEEECLKILALHQPVAIDLRYLVAVMKINNDLERIGDLATNIAQHAIKIIKQPKLQKPPINLDNLYNNVQSMLKKSLDSIVKLDVDAAFDIMKADDEVDRMHDGLSNQVLDQMKTNPNKVHTLIQYIHIIRHLERIADHATNIAEDIIYLTQGKIVRHGEKNI